MKGRGGADVFLVAPVALPLGARFEGAMTVVISEEAVVYMRWMSGRREGLWANISARGSLGDKKGLRMLLLGFVTDELRHLVTYNTSHF